MFTWCLLDPDMFALPPQLSSNVDRYPLGERKHVGVQEAPREHWDVCRGAQQLDVGGPPDHPLEHAMGLEVLEVDHITVRMGPPATRGQGLAVAHFPYEVVHELLVEPAVLVHLNQLGHGR